MCKEAFSGYQSIVKRTLNDYSQRQASLAAGALDGQLAAQRLRGCNSSMLTRGVLAARMRANSHPATALDEFVVVVVDAPCMFDGRPHCDKQSSTDRMCHGAQGWREGRTRQHPMPIGALRRRQRRCARSSRTSGVCRTCCLSCPRATGGSCVELVWNRSRCTCARSFQRCAPYSMQARCAKHILCVAGESNPAVAVRLLKQAAQTLDADRPSVGSTEHRSRRARQDGCK